MNIQEFIDSIKHSIKTLSINNNNEVLLTIFNNSVRDISQRTLAHKGSIDYRLNTDKAIYTLPKDCIQIYKAYDDQGNDRPIDVTGNPNSIYTIDSDTFQVANPITDVVLTIVYFKLVEGLKLEDEFPFNHSFFSVVQNRMIMECYDTYLRDGDQYTKKMYYQRFHNDLRDLTRLNNVYLERRYDPIKRKGLI
jgi:hypothetical protein